MLLISPDRTRHEVQVQEKTIEDILLCLCIEPLEVLISRDGVIIPEDVIPDEDDTITLIRISHGG